MKFLANISRKAKLGIALMLLLGAQPAFAEDFSLQSAFSLCQSLSTVAESKRAKHLAAQGFSPAPKTKVVEAVDHFQRLNLDPSKGSISSTDATFRDLVERRVARHLAPKGFAATRFKPQKAYVNAQGDLFLVGGISDRKYLDKVRKGLVRCDLYAKTWTPKNKATKLIKSATSQPARKNGSSGKFYQLVGNSQPSPALVSLEITTFKKSSGIPAMTRLFVELTADLSS